ncbi:hypothetical protein [Streptomyces sp. NPDC058861]|uniref:hypothetical protein n=1 Tax=Streptomyces sp. NPDC058861 TaxID=3346653 RepID=UPI00369E9726
MSTLTYTYKQVRKAMNHGADMVMEEVGGDRDTDLVNLVVNAALALLDDPSMDIDAVIEASYEDPDEVRTWF